MYTRVKSASEIKAMRTSSKITAQILAAAMKMVEPGLSGVDINAFIQKEIKKRGAKPAFLNYQGFPAVVCVSLNDQVVHGIPNGTGFKTGDLVSLDFGVIYDGMISDHAKTIIVGDDVNNQEFDKKRKLLAGTEESLVAGIKAVKAGAKTGDIGAAVQAVLARYGFGIVRDLVGHGVGHQVHEEPNIPNFGTAGYGDELKEGMTIAIEPMATLGDHSVVTDPDGWTIRTTDGSLAAHFEHTVLVTKDGSDILTSL